MTIGRTNKPRLDLMRNLRPFNSKAHRAKLNAAFATPLDHDQQYFNLDPSPNPTPVSLTKAELSLISANDLLKLFS